KGRAGRSLRLELERHAVHAVALAGRLRAVVEDMAEMAAAARAMHLGADHAEAVIRGGGNRILARRPEAGPAATGVELGVGIEQHLAAAGAEETARPEFAVERAGMRPLGGMLAQHGILFRRQSAPPLRVVMLHLEMLSPSAFVASEQFHVPIPW